MDLKNRHIGPKTSRFSGMAIMRGYSLPLPQGWPPRSYFVSFGPILYIFILKQNYLDFMSAQDEAKGTIKLATRPWPLTQSFLILFCLF